MAAAGLLIIPNYMPALDGNADPIAGAKMFFYLNETATLTTVYSDISLTVPLPNPVEADNAGVFPLIYADNELLFSVAVTTSEGELLASYDNVMPSFAVYQGLGDLNPTKIYNRNELVFYAEDYGVSPGATGAVNTAGIEAAQQAILASSAGRGILMFGSGIFQLAASTSTEYFDADGAQIPATGCCIIQREGVSFQGQGRMNTFFYTPDGSTSFIYAVSPRGQFVRDIGCDGRVLFNPSGGTSHGILQLVPSDYNLPNIAAPGTFAVDLEGWNSYGSGAISRVLISSTYYMRLTASAVIVTKPGCYKGFPTTIGRNYRVRAGSLAQTAGFQKLCVSTTSSPTDIYQSVNYSNPLSPAEYMNFTATSTTTYIHFQGIATPAINTYADFTSVVLVDWPIADQKSYCYDYRVEFNMFQNFGSYGLGIQVGDVTGPYVNGNWFYNIGADGMDIKARGISGVASTFDIQGFVISNNYLKKCGQRTNLTNQSYIDIRGQPECYGNYINIVGGDIGSSRTGIRARQGDAILTGGIYTRIIGNYIDADTQTGTIGICPWAHHCIASENVIIGMGSAVTVAGYDTGAGDSYYTHDVKVSDNQFISCGLGVQTNQQSLRTVVSGNVGKDITGIFLDLRGTADAAYNNTVYNTGSYANLAGDDVVVRGGRLAGTVTGTKVFKSGARVQISGIDGYITQNRALSGTFALDAVTAGILSINHGLDVTPTGADVTISANIAASNSDFSLRISSLSSTVVGVTWKVTTAGAGGTTGTVSVNVNTDRQGGVAA